MMTVTFTEQVRWEVLAKYMRSPSGSVPSQAEAATGQETDPGDLTAREQRDCGSAPVSRLQLTLQVSWSENVPFSQRSVSGCVSHLPTQGGSHQSRENL